MERGDGGRVKQITPTGTTRYLGEVYEVAPSGTKTKYVFAGSVRLAAKDSTGTTRFYHTDHLGSSNVVTDKTGVIVEIAEYTPYGSLSRREGSANVPQKFTGQRLDASTGLYFYQARYYDPVVGRFISADPTVQHPEDPQDLNRYAYARNNPINLVDPSGYSFWRAFFGIVAIVAAVVSFGAGFVAGFATAFDAMGVAAAASTVGAVAGGVALASGVGYLAASVGGGGGGGRGPRPQPTKSWALKDTGGRFWTNFATNPAVSGTASFGAGFAPVAGEIQDFAGAAFGVDVITGERLSPGDRLLSGAALFVPFVGAASIRHGGRALNHLVRSGPKKPVVIGETMERVKRGAEKVDGRYYKPRPARNLEHAKRKNQRWIKDVMRQDLTVYDVGVDKVRRLPGGRGPGKFYEPVELPEIQKVNYPTIPLDVD